MVTLETSVNGLFKGDYEDLLEQFTRHNTSNYDRAERLSHFYIKWGKILNKRADFAWCQMEHETGFLNFTGDVGPHQNNFSGIGATGGVPGNSFATEELGVIAQMVHIAWYSEMEHLTVKDDAGVLYCSKKYDPRHFDYFDPNGHRYRGGDIASFSDAWAVGGGIAYSKRIVEYMNEIAVNQDTSPIHPDYDLIVQMGHVGRTTGATGARGEMAFNKSLGEAINHIFVAEHPDIRFRLMKADNWYKPEPNLTKLFFSIHADGSSNPLARGFSVGYPPDSDNAFAEYVVEAYDILTDFPQRPDNYTNGLKFYYAWRNNHVKANYYCLLEHGFMSNAYESDWIKQHVVRIARSHVNTFLGFLKLKYNI